MALRLRKLGAFLPCAPGKGLGARSRVQSGSPLFGLGGPTHKLVVPDWGLGPNCKRPAELGGAASKAVDPRISARCLRRAVVTSVKYEIFCCLTFG